MHIPWLNSLDILDLLVASLSPPEIKVARVHTGNSAACHVGISMTKTAIPVFIYLFKGAVTDGSQWTTSRPPTSYLFNKID